MNMLPSLAEVDIEPGTSLELSHIFMSVQSVDKYEVNWFILVYLSICIIFSSLNEQHQYCLSYLVDRSKRMKSQNIQTRGSWFLIHIICICGLNIRERAAYLLFLCGWGIVVHSFILHHWTYYTGVFVLHIIRQLY